jgi:hypothetical protein
MSTLLIMPIGMDCLERWGLAEPVRASGCPPSRSWTMGPAAIIRMARPDYFADPTPLTRGWSRHAGIRAMYARVCASASRRDEPGFSRICHCTIRSKRSSNG